MAEPWADHRTAVRVCRVCGARNDSAMTESGTTPHEGAVSICVVCATITVFTAGGGAREPTIEEVNEFIQLPELLRYVGAIHSRENLTERNRK